MSLWKKSFALLIMGLLFVGCGSTDDFVFNSGSNTATVVVNHVLFRGVPATVENKVFTGSDAAGSVTFGSVEYPKAATIRLEGVPTSTTLLEIEYLDTDFDPPRLVGRAALSLQLNPGDVVTVNPQIESVVATTLDRTIQPEENANGYKKLVYGPAWERVVREDLAMANPDRASQREPLLSIAHVSDIHLADSESPLRIEFLRNLKGFKLPATLFQGAWRPQETLLTQVAEAMVGQLNTLSSGPVTGRPYDFAISTGDNSDNRHFIELERFITILDGGQVTPSSGDPNLYEGVQDGVHFDAQYWHPESGPDDQYKTMYGFPDYPGLLQAAVQPFRAQGLNVPWYSAYGNHDFLLQGNFIEKDQIAPLNAMNQISTGDRKILALPLVYALLDLAVEGSGVDLFLVEWIDPIDLTNSWANFIGHWNSLTTPSRQVTPDPDRRIVSRQDFIQAHLDSPATPGPVGHGFTQSNLANDTLYYTFEPAPGILGITLDTVNPGGEADGSLGLSQVQWMEERLKEVHSQYYDIGGNLIQTGNEDKLVILFSHHHLSTLTNPLPNPNNPGDPRVLDGVFEATLHRYPNVVLWLNGHSHFCRIFGHSDPQGRTGGFWEVNTPSHIDFPQQSRIVEMVDNRDGTLSVFATLVDHAGHAETGPVTTDIERLAAISRELSANDPQVDLSVQLGTPEDRNVELLIQTPFTR
jgi:metallophosphoesterase (TIGR03767 family)